MDTKYPELEIAAARYVLGLLKSEDLVRIADAALNCGIYSDSLCRVAYSDDPRMDEVGPLFEKGLRELTIALPSREDATWRLLRHHIESIATGQVEPREGLARVVDEVYSPANLHERSLAYAGDSHGIELFTRRTGVITT